jgi:hypothetical protein
MTPRARPRPPPAINTSRLDVVQGVQTEAMKLTPAQRRLLAQIHISGAWQATPDFPILLGRHGGAVAHRATVAALIRHGHLEPFEDEDAATSFRVSAAGPTELGKHPRLVEEARIEDVGLRHGVRARKH